VSVPGGRRDLRFLVDEVIEGGAEAVDARHHLEFAGDLVEHRRVRRIGVTRFLRQGHGGEGQELEQGLSVEVA
jgi:hypothetical protein